MIIEFIIFLAVSIFLLLLIATVFAHIFFLVPYVPSKLKVVEKMIKVADLKKNEIVYDLGCGDGRLLFAAERHREIKGVGFEIAPLIYFLALIKKILNNSKSKIYFRNFFSINLKKADVIFCYLLPAAMTRLSEKIKHECKGGTRIISHTFHLPGFKPAKILKRNAKADLPTVYLYKI